MTRLLLSYHNHKITSHPLNIWRTGKISNSILNSAQFPTTSSCRVSFVKHICHEKYGLSFLNWKGFRFQRLNISPWERKNNAKQYRTTVHRKHTNQATMRSQVLLPHQFHLSRRIIFYQIGLECVVGQSGPDPLELVRAKHFNATNC